MEIERQSSGDTAYLWGLVAYISNSLAGVIEVITTGKMCMPGPFEYHTESL